MSESTETAAILDQHEPGEAVGGFTCCSCGWPTREQYDAGEHFVVHVIAALGLSLPPGSPDSHEWLGMKR